MWKSPVYFHTLFIPGEGVIVHLYWATMYAWSNALDKYMWKTLTSLSCSERVVLAIAVIIISTEKLAQRKCQRSWVPMTVRFLYIHVWCVMCYVMCDVWSSYTLYNWITLTNLSSLSCLLTSCGFLSRVNFIMGRIGKVSVWTQYQHRGMRQFWSIRSGYCEAILSFWRWSHEDEKPYY